MTSNGSMPGSRCGHLRHVRRPCPTPPLAAVSLVAHGEPGAAEVLDADDEAGVEQREARLDQPLLLERVADLHARALVGVGSSSPKPGRRQHADAADAVATGRRAEQHRQVADARSPGRARAARSAARPRQSTLTSGLSGVGLVEHDLAADGRHADGVAVAGDARHDALGDPPAAGVVERAEPERVHHGDRAGTHGEDVAQDAADAGGRALVRLDGRRVVVALDADGGGDAVTDVDDAGALARADQHPRRLGRAAAAGGCGTTCTSSAPTTSPRTWPARGGSAPGRGSARSRRLVVGEPERPVERQSAASSDRTGRDRTTRGPNERRARGRAIDRK